MNSSSIELNYYHEARKILSSSQKTNVMLFPSPKHAAAYQGFQLSGG